jgi:hypothetical protein
MEIAEAKIRCETPGKFRVANHVGRAVVNLGFVEKDCAVTKLLMWRSIGLINGAVNNIFG